MHGIGPILSTVIMLGFAYMLWIFAGKEKDKVQTVGKALAIILVFTAVLQFVMFGLHGPRGPRCPDMQKKCMMEQRDGAQGDFDARHNDQDGKFPGRGADNTAQPEQKK